MSKAKPSASKSTPPRRRPAVNFTMEERLRKVAENEAEKFGLYTAQGGDQRPRISAIFGGMALMLERGQLDESVLYASACEVSSLEPETDIVAHLANNTNKGMPACA